MLTCLLNDKNQVYNGSKCLEMEPVIVVTGKPATPNRYKSYWIQYLLAFNFGYFVYYCMAEDYSQTYDFVFFFMTYALYGVYLPAYGLKCLSENKPTDIFVVWQCGLSTFHLMTSLFTIITYYNYEKLCRDCLDVFRAGHEVCETTWMTNDITIELDNCLQLPDEDAFLCKHSLAILVSLVGIMTTYKVSRVERNTNTVEAIQVSDPAVLAQILEQYVENV